MRQSDKISVLMGVYNCQSYEEIERAVRSIIDQTYPNWELIICDDGSTNETVQWLHEVAKLDARIRIIGYQENHGLAYALNECLKASTGEFIARQDTSDYSYPERFEKELKALRDNPQIDFVSCIADVFDEKHGIWGKLHFSEYPHKKAFLFNSPFLHPGLLCPTAVLLSVNGYRLYKRSQDYDLFMRLYAVGYRGMNVQQTLYAYEYEKEPLKDKRTLFYRLEEMKIRFLGFSALNILFPTGIIFAIKPIIVYIIPMRIKNIIKAIQFKRK